MLTNEVNTTLLEASMRDTIEKKFKISKFEDGLGFSEVNQKWYGWSHRAIFGFGIGDMQFDQKWVHPDDDPNDRWDEQVNTNKTCFALHGTVKIKNLEQAKEAAKEFADSVS